MARTIAGYGGPLDFSSWNPKTATSEEEDHRSFVATSNLKMQSNGPQTAAAAASASAPDDFSPAAVTADTRGKHRISAELKRLDQEARYLETELEELEKMEKVSAALQEYGLLFKVESIPDPLLPATTGTVNTSWDRWFEGPQDMHTCRCWIL